MLGRRGVADQSIEWFTALIITAFALVVLIVITTSFSNREINTQEIETTIFYAKLYYELGVEFNEKDIPIFDYEDPTIGAKMTVKSIDNKTLHEWYQNKDVYDRLRPLAINEVAGGGLFDTFNYPVVYENQNAHLFIEVAVE